MKRILLAAIAVVLCVVSCQKDSVNKIIGTWEGSTIEMSMEGLNMNVDLKEVGMDITLNFKKDGTGTVTETYDGDDVTESFEYSYDGETLSLTEEGVTMGVPAEISGKTLTIKINGKLIDEEAFDGEVILHFNKK